MDGPSNASFERWLEMNRLDRSVHLVERSPLSDGLHMRVSEGVGGERGRRTRVGRSGSVTSDILTCEPSLDLRSRGVVAMIIMSVWR